MSSPRFHGVFGPLLGGKVGIREDESLEGSSASSAPAKIGQIAVDIYEDGGYLVVKAPVAGVKLADLDIDVAENVITIRGKREQCDTVEDEKYFLQECYWGEFSRSVTLPFPVNPTKIKATFSKDNILKIFVPKEERRVKIVKINEGG
jgi:HSP20 family protein